MIKICLAILKLPDSHITKRQLRTAWDSNDDGAGFMYNQNKNLIIDKGYFTFRKFYKALRDAENNNPKAIFVIHLRLATSGKKDDINCHPFSVHEDLGFVHNGIFREYGNYTDFSDTAIFNMKILRTFPKDFIFNKGIIKLLEEYCEYMNKLVFLNNKGEYLIIGEDCGDWIEDIWFSNKGYEKDFGFSSKVYDGCECDVCGCYYAFSEVNWNEYTRSYTCKYCGNEGNLVENLCPICNAILPEKNQYCPQCKCYMRGE